MEEQERPVAVIDGRGKKRGADGHAVIGIRIIFVVVIIIIGAFGTVGDGRAGVIVGIPVQGTGLIGKVEIFGNNG